MTHRDDAGTPRYTDEELTRIIERAAELHGHHGAREEGYSLAEIQQVAKEAGIAPRHVAAAAAELSAGRVPGVVPGTGAAGPAGIFRMERTYDAELSRTAQLDLVDVMRQETGLPGAVTEELGDLVWSGSNGITTTRLSVRAREGRTKVSLVVNHAEARILAWLGATIAGLFLGLLTAILLREFGMPKPPALLVGLGVWGASALAGGKVAWRRMSAGMLGRARAIAGRVAEVAGEGVGEGPTCEERLPPGP